MKYRQISCNDLSICIYTWLELNQRVSVFVFILSIAQASAQTDKTLPHCNCIEIRTVDAYKVSTNKESKLHNVKPSKATLEFLKDQLKEYIWLAGPWVNGQNTEINIQIPLVINNLKKH